MQNTKPPVDVPRHMAAVGAGAAAGAGPGNTVRRAAPAPVPHEILEATGDEHAVAGQVRYAVSSSHMPVHIFTALRELFVALLRVSVYAASVVLDGVSLRMRTHAHKAQKGESAAARASAAFLRAVFQAYSKVPPCKRQKVKRAPRAVPKKRDAGVDKVSEKFDESEVVTDLARIPNFEKLITVRQIVDVHAQCLGTRTFFSSMHSAVYTGQLRAVRVWPCLPWFVCTRLVYNATL